MCEEKKKKNFFLFGIYYANKYNNQSLLYEYVFKYLNYKSNIYIYIFFFD